jgi:type I restriction enzyme S subunit
MKLPDGWEMHSLGELFTFKNGVNTEKASYGKGIKFINVMDVLQGNSITPDIIPGQITLPDKKMKENLVKKGDVLFNRTSETPEEIGMTSVYLDDEDVVFGGFVIKGHPIDNKLDNMFKKYCFFSEKVRKEIIRRGQGAVRANIGQNDLSKVSMMLPPLPEQKAIADLLSTWDEAIENTEKLIWAKRNN